MSSRPPEQPPCSLNVYNLFFSLFIETSKRTVLALSRRAFCIACITITQICSSRPSAAIQYCINKVNVTSSRDKFVDNDDELVLCVVVLTFVTNIYRIFSRNVVLAPTAPAHCVPLGSITTLDPPLFVVRVDLHPVSLATSFAGGSARIAFSSGICTSKGRE